jgi:N-acetylmuramoyl-L-alanine amidase
VQRAVGVDVDGLCGTQTVVAIKKYQLANSLLADGEVGLNTWKKILGIK